MALVALLSARDGALIDFGGQPLAEYQARLAINAGAERLLVHVDVATHELAQLVDRLSAERGCDVAIFQDMTTLSRALAVDDRVLLIAENLVPPPEALASLLVAGPVAMLALPAVPATARFERIDGDAMWGGALCLPGSAVLATLDMLGDWDLSLTLLRRAVQEGARRVALSPELVMDGRLALVRDQASADIALHALSDLDRVVGGARGAGLGSLLEPLSRPLVRELVRRQIEPSTLVLFALLLGIGGLALAISAWMLPALLILLLALGGSDLARRTAQVTLRTSGSPWLHRLVEASGVAVLGLLGYRLSGGQLLALAGAWLPILLIGLFALVDELSPPTGLWARWARVTLPMALALVFAGQLLGMAPAAFALLGLLTCAMVAVRSFPAGQSRS